MVEVNFNRSEVLILVLRLTFVTTVTYFSMKWLMTHLDPTNKAKKNAREKAQNQLKKLSGNGLGTDQKLSDYEMMIAAHLVHPNEINVSWSAIAGLDELIQELKETVILPINRKELFADSQLTSAPKGVLLHGPPGCGKTMIAKATAKEANTRFINLDLSILTDKWYGESQKLASAVFTLATKLQPCIIFIDEIDSFLRARNNTDHEATAMMKAQFMSLWDGLSTNSDCMVIVMGATNRPQDIDKAILRRMPATFYVPMPNLAQREQILSLILRNEPIASDVDLKRLAKLSDGFSGSDLRELCRSGSVYRVRDYMKGQNSLQLDDEYYDALRPITMDDLIVSYHKMNESKKHCGTMLMSNRIELD